MKSLLTLAALTAALALPLTATGQTCEEMKADLAWAIEELEFYQSEMRREIQKAEQLLAEMRVGNIDRATSHAISEEFSRQAKKNEESSGNITILADTLSFTAKAKNCW